MVKIFDIQFGEEKKKETWTSQNVTWIRCIFLQNIRRFILNYYLFNCSYLYNSISGDPLSYNLGLYHTLTAPE